jgi:hypothetical protein
MKKLVITVNYVVDPAGKARLDVEPQVTQATANDTLDFRQTGSAGTMRITFPEKELFSAGNPKFSASGEFFKGDEPVKVNTVKGLGGNDSRKTSFLCELLDPQGKVLMKSTDPGNAGGAIEIRNG